VKTYNQFVLKVVDNPAARMTANWPAGKCSLSCCTTTSFPTAIYVTLINFLLKLKVYECNIVVMYQWS